MGVCVCACVSLCVCVLVCFWNDVCCMRKQGLQQAILDTPIKRPRAKKERESSQSPPKNYSFIESDDESDDDSDDESNTKH